MNISSISPEQHQKNLERLRQLNKDLPPDDVKILLRLDRDVSYEEVIKDTVTMLNGLETYIKNGHSLEGLPQEIRDTFGEIRVYSTSDRVA